MSEPFKPGWWVLCVCVCVNYLYQDSSILGSKTKFLLAKFCVELLVTLSLAHDEN